MNLYSGLQAIFVYNVQYMIELQSISLTLYGYATH